MRAWPPEGGRYACRMPALLRSVIDADEEHSQEWLCYRRLGFAVEDEVG